MARELARESLLLLVIDLSSLIGGDLHVDQSENSGWQVSITHILVVVGVMNNSNFNFNYFE